VSTQAASSSGLMTSIKQAFDSKRINHFFSRLGDLFLNAVIQVRIYDRIYVGIMHALIFWGVTLQAISAAIALMQMKLFVPFVELSFPRDGMYLVYEIIMDLAGVAILLGVLMAAFRRYVLRPKSLPTRWDDTYALVLLTLIVLTGFITEATRLEAASPPWANWSPIGNWMAGLLSNLGLTGQEAANIRNYLVVLHIFLGLSLVASIPYTKLRHLVNGPLNILGRRRENPGNLLMIENIEETEVLGVGDISEFTPHQLLSFDACLNCGRCEDACPATISGTAYSPRILIQLLRQDMVDKLTYPEHSKDQPNLTLHDSLGDQSVWDCTTCGACIECCPVYINPVDEVVDLRRYLVLTTGKLPKTIADTLRNLERKGNPWGFPQEEKIDWTEGLDVRELAPGDETDVLLYLGCALSLDNRGRKAAAALSHLLTKNNIDFGILGLDETCCGDMARRMGHEYIFQTFAEQLNETLSAVKFNRIVTQCAHCFNALKNEYPQLGFHYKVQHYTDYLVEQGIMSTQTSGNGDGITGKVAYHDSCYLGRYNKVFNSPRQLLKASGVETIEFRRHGETSFCCGGGGGLMWMESDVEIPINQIRLQEAQSIQADVIATACPYCMIMFDAAIRSKGVGENINVMDIAEILERQAS